MGNKRKHVKRILTTLLMIGCFTSAQIMPSVSAAGGQQIDRPLGSTVAPFGFYEYLPEGYEADSEKTWPVVIFLHGAGERGNGTTELTNVLKWGPPKNIKNGTKYPFICISPQLASGIWWKDQVPAIDAMLEYVKSNYRVDTRRIYMTGMSMGGGGTWRYASQYPEKLAAIVPVCGAYKIDTETSTDSTKIKDIPVWAFHSWGDPTVYVTDSISNANKIAGKVIGSGATNLLVNYPGTYTGPGPNTNCDATRTASFSPSYGWRWRYDIENIVQDKLKLTLLPSVDHDAWTVAYSNQTMWNWLLAQSTRPTPKITAAAAIR